jgi:hypothetical protein
MNELQVVAVVTDPHGTIRDTLVLKVEIDPFEAKDDGTFVVLPKPLVSSAWIASVDREHLRVHPAEMI